MEDRTRAYLRGRFRDYYRRANVLSPPDAGQREWGYIPFSPDGTTMVRHQSLVDIGSVSEFLADRRPRHVYFSAGYYETPGAQTMEEKNWQGSDLVFDLDADHLPGINPDETTYKAMLTACKDALMRLLSFIEEDFNFTDLTVVFSGSRGYHVHVRDESVKKLDREDRREIVEYIRGVDVGVDQIIDTEAVQGTAGRKSPAEKRTLRTNGGWGRRVHEQLVELVSELQTIDEKQATMRLQSFEGIGTESTTAILRAIQENPDAIKQGNIDLHSAFLKIVRKLTEETIKNERAPIDEPVTTDTHRLIRLPGSLHGGSGLRVQRIDRDEISDFDPLVDAVPEAFTKHDITIEITDLSEYPPYDEDSWGKIELGGDSFELTEGLDSYPEYLGVFLMTRGHAEKEKE